MRIRLVGLMAAVLCICLCADLQRLRNCKLNQQYKFWGKHAQQQGLYCTQKFIHCGPYHICKGLGAHWTGVLGTCVFLVAIRVHEVAARSLSDWLTAREHILVADRAVVLQASLSAHVRISQRQRHALVALHTMEDINAQSFAPARHTSPKQI